MPYSSKANALQRVAVLGNNSGGSKGISWWVGELWPIVALLRARVDTLVDMSYCNLDVLNYCLWNTKIDI